MSTATLTSKDRDIHDWTSRDHAPDCPVSRWNRLPKDQQNVYHQAIGPEQREAFAAKTGASPECAGVPGVCCPEDVVVNAGVQSVILGAPGAKDEGKGIGQDSPRIDVGDRRQGKYYVDLIRRGAVSGLQQVRRVSVERLAELEKQRQIREGIRPADWILKQRAKAAAGEQPAPFADRSTAMSELQRAAYGVPDPCAGHAHAAPMTARPEA